MDAERFGAFVQTRRKELGMKQADLAQQIHVTDKAISRWERGVGFPDIKLLEPLAQALDVSILELIRSERIEEKSISTGEAAEAVAKTLDVACTQHRSIYRHPAYWIFSLAIYAVMAYLIVTLCYFVDAVWIRVMAVYLVLVCASFGISGVSALLEQLLNPSIPLKPRKKRYYVLQTIAFLGGLLLVLSFPIKEEKGQELCDILRLAGFAMMLPNFLYAYFSGKKDDD